MTEPGQHQPVDDSPTGWVAKHIDQYVETDGAVGAKHNGIDALLITTRGRRSGRLRRTALFYGHDSDHYLLVASNGGAKHHPQWYLNLLVNPEVEVQIGAEKFTARARKAADDERPRLWPLMAAVFPMFDAYQRKAGREIPIVVLERI